MTSPAVPIAVLFLHNLFTAIWVGGLIILGAVVLPVTNKILGKGAKTKELIDKVQNRLSAFVVVSILGLLGTGMLLARRAPQLEGLFSFANGYSTVLAIKHIVVILMVVVALLRRIALKQRGEALQPRRRKAGLGLLYVNMAMGILVLLLSAMSVVLSSPVQ
jgi:putative copper export protein